MRTTYFKVDAWIQINLQSMEAILRVLEQVFRNYFFSLKSFEIGVRFYASVHL